MPPPPQLLLFFLLLLPSSPAAAASANASASFSLNFFPAASAVAVAQLALSGGASANATAFPGAISMAAPGARVQHRRPILLSASGFSTYFAFALLPAASPPPSLAFFLTPSAASPAALALVFSARHVRLDLAGRAVVQASCPPAAAATRLHAWVDYNATAAALHLRLSGSAARLPSSPLLSYPLRLRTGPVLAGFRTSSGNCSLFSWAFRAAPPNPMHSQPLDPADLSAARSSTPPLPHRVPDRRRYSPAPSPSPWAAAVSLLFAAACGAMLTFFLFFICYSVAKRRPVAPVEFPMHPSGSDVVYHKIVLVGAKDDAAAADHDVIPPSAAGNK
ncbi:hypothetical protein BS78_10G070900 [Paspalum vaginatum]|nr:hypothetical protein BS78_10G070900 [Paspalum vaginatum]